MSLSNTYETKLLQWAFTADSVTRPTAWYVALFTSNPDEDNSGSEVSTSGTAYARVSATFSDSGNTVSNDSAIEYATATASFGTVTHVGVMDAATGGELIAYATLTSSKTIDTGDVFRIPAGDLDIIFD
jgi:hypothetical protein